MKSFLVCLLVNLVFLTVIEARSLADDVETGSKKGHTCVFNNVEYQEGDELPTRGKCWLCTCREGFVKPGPEFCARINCPNHENPGCEPVYDENECCPVKYDCDNLSNTSPVVDNCKCDDRYFKHYEVKQCKPVYEEGCDCPVRYDCPENFMEDDSVCYHKGKTYALHEPMESTNPCQKCSCEQSFFPDTGVRINCISIECASTFGRPEIEEGCYDTFELNQCCETGKKCDDKVGVNETAVTEPVCELDGKVYHVGQMMYPSENECLSCICDENWNGISSNNCRVLDCMLEKYKTDLKAGCLPIYHESTCCPIEFHCANEEEDTIIPLNKVPLTGAQEQDPLKQCVFGGKKYNLGDLLDIRHPTNCVTCTCTTPPDFTCIHKTCPRPPNDDYENCRSTYTPGECCPTYDCVQQTSPYLDCEPVLCGFGCSEVRVPYGCPMCMCNEVLCSPPKCAPDCLIDYEASPCPTCKCSETIPLDRPMCGPVKCGPECQEAISPQGCPMCVCGPLCSPPKCRHGCHVQMNVADGECPYCVCDEDTVPDLANRILCSPVKCPSFCSEATGEHGCPMCICEPMCSPPKCEPGCTAEVVPSSGPCPGCVCDKQALLQCDPVKCPSGCTEYVPPNSCPICKCEDILCSIPKCPVGCDLNNDVVPGSCPHCKCPPTIPLDRPQCGPVKCAPQCFEAVSPQGCPMCICGPLCSPPKCDPGCNLQTDVPEGQCPGCDCPDDKPLSGRENKIRCSPVRCPPECSEATGENGCPMCLCQPLCSPPKCGLGCRIVASDPCPTCVCGVERPQCGIVHCGPNCYESISSQGCPMCVCGPQCSPPKCSSGCYVQTNVPEGLCPGCECRSFHEAVPDNAPMASAPAVCPNYCRTVVSQSGEPGCICESPNLPVIMCSPPKCDDPGCEIKLTNGPCPACVCDGIKANPDCPPVKCGPHCEAEVFPSGCPMCVCHTCSGSDCPPDNLNLDCLPVKCAPHCREVFSSGCPMCVCGPLCSPPKCQPGCYEQQNVPIGQCPGCECPSFLSSTSDKGFRWCPFEKCEECEEVKQPDRCLACKCGDECVPPKCPKTCEVEKDVPPGVCPACFCPYNKTSEIKCPDLPCELPCTLVRLTPDTCPMCQCTQLPFQPQHLPKITG